VFDRHTEPQRASTSDSASSISVSTGWDRPSSAFTADQSIKVTPPSPIVRGNTRHSPAVFPSPNPKMPTNLRYSSQPMPCPETPKPARDRRTSPPSVKTTSTTTPRAPHAPTLKAPQPPNPSRTRPVQRQATIASQGIAVETARAGVIVPVGAVQVRAARNPTADLHRAGTSARRARSVSPPPTPATALWMGDKTLWRESQLW
jgi:hypothetical protein